MPPSLARRAPPSRAALAATALIAAGAAGAADFDTIGRLDQAEFRAFAEDVAAAVSHKALIPSEGLGITGFDLGVSAGATEVSHRDVLRKAAGGASIPGAIPVVGLRAVKGLPFDVDVGLVATTLPGTNVRATGGELRWAVVGGNALVPAVALRVATSRLSGVDQLDLRTTQADVSISKGFAFLTPYAGIGRVDVRSSAPGTALRAENFDLPKVFAGVNIAFVPFAFVVEADRTGDATGVAVKFALRW